MVMSACHVAADLPGGPLLSPAETTFRWLAHPYAFLDECAAAFGDTFTLRFARFGTHVHSLMCQPVDRLHIGLLGLPHARLAEVEQGNLERDREPAVADVFAGLLVLGELVGVARVQNVDKSGRVGEAVGFGKCV